MKSGLRWPVFVLAVVSAAVIQWMLALRLNDDITKVVRRPDGRTLSDAIRDDAAILGLSEKLRENPLDIEGRLRLARVLEAKAVGLGDASMLMKAIGYYREVLQIDSTNEQALLRIAELSLDFGVFDKAVHYYERYLALRPDDAGARAAYRIALTGARFGDGEQKPSGAGRETAPTSDEKRP